MRMITTSTDTITNIYRRANGSRNKNQKYRTIYIKPGCVVENNNQLTFSNWKDYTIEECLIKAHSHGYVITKIYFSKPQFSSQGNGNFRIQKIRTGEISDGVD